MYAYIFVYVYCMLVSNTDIKNPSQVKLSPKSVVFLYIIVRRKYYLNQFLMR